MQAASSPTSPDAIIQCRSCALTSYECNYTTIELEALAMAWACEKCDFFLWGCPNFTIVTDHRPLLGICDKPLANISNPQILRFRECLLAFQFDVMWLCGKANAIADALSWNPVDKPLSNFGIHSYVIGGSNIVDDLKKAAAACQSYQEIILDLTFGKTLDYLTSFDDFDDYLVIYLGVKKWRTCGGRRQQPTRW